MNVRKRIVGLTVAAALFGGMTALPATTAFAAPPASAPGSKPKSSVYYPLAFTGTDQNGNAVQGTITKLRTYVQNGKLMATGSVVTADPATGQQVTAPFTTAVKDVRVTGSSMAAARAEIPSGCTVLNLELAPLQLDLLGLVVTLPNPLVVDITAVPGAGNLLGNLLCSVAGILDGGGLLSGAINGISALLNRLLSGLGL
ncbi:hypothetical protein [Granulicoccus sp. GXG6511]|uniref:hypothetical protein n=1 Tax=Granulicoccus sp. GXG6511 TaxID=3381351 RepID=UPI003D7E41DA